MSSDTHTLKRLKEHLRKLKAFEKDLPQLTKTLARHIAQQARQRPGQKV